MPVAPRAAKVAGLAESLSMPSPRRGYCPRRRSASLNSSANAWAGH